MLAVLLVKKTMRLGVLFASECDDIRWVICPAHMFRDDVMPVHTVR